MKYVVSQASWVLVDQSRAAPEYNTFVFNAGGSKISVSEVRPLETFPVNPLTSTTCVLLR